MVALVKKSFYQNFSPNFHFFQKSFAAQFSTNLAQFSTTFVFLKKENDRANFLDIVHIHVFQFWLFKMKPLIGKPYRYCNAFLVNGK